VSQDFHYMRETSEVREGDKKLALIVYILQVIGLFIGLTLIIGVIIDYVKRADAAGSWLESHYRWQIRTFWFSLLFAFIGVATSVIGVGYIILVGDAIWLIYRIAKGLLYLNDEREMYPRSGSAS
jgi:uncharacterized membrane protein